MSGSESKGEVEQTWARAPNADEEYPDEPVVAAPKEEDSNSVIVTAEMIREKERKQAEERAREEGSAFQPLAADDDIDAITSLESVCMACFERTGDEVMGVTRLLPTRIPYFRDVIVMAFECGTCGFRSSELQPANEYGSRGCRFHLQINPADAATCKMDLNRQVIKSENATIYIPEAEFEIPAASKRGEISTVEGIIAIAAENLQHGQEERRRAHPEVAEKLQAVIDKLKAMAEGREAFSFILDDAGGNSFLENPYAPSSDRRVAISYYGRSPQQNAALGIVEEGDEMAAVPASSSFTYRDKLRGARYQVAAAVESKVTDWAENGILIPGTCHECRKECETRMCTTDIPFFKEVIIMVTDCANCGYRDAEVKPGGAVSAKGTRVTVDVRNADDLKRDIMKSDTSGLSIPDLDLVLDAGTLGGKYTTLEGILADIRTQLESSNAFVMGDSSDSETKAKMESFFKRYDEIQAVNRPFTLILDDPMGNAFVGALTAPDPDPQLKIESYERSFEQNEDLGLNDIDVDEKSYVVRHRRESMDAADAEAGTGSVAAASGATSASAAATGKETPAPAPSPAS